MVRKPVITESELKTLIACPRLFHLGGSIYNLEPSQTFVRYALRLLNIKLLKPVKDIDLLINDCVNKAYLKVFVNQEIEDNVIVGLKSYAFTFLNNYLNYFNAKEYTMILGPTKPLLEFEDISLRLDLEAVFKQNNRTKFLHAICFYPKVDQHVLSSDITLRAKALYLKQYASFSIPKEKHEEVTIHLIGLPRYNKYKAKHSPHLYLHKKYNLSQEHLPDIKEYVDLAVSNKKINIAPPYCPNTNCLKRNVCNVELR